MNEWVLLVVGLVFGGAVGWLWASFKSKNTLSQTQVEAEGRVKAAESTISELRGQLTALQSSLEARGQELATFQRQLKGEGEQKVAAQTELRQLQSSLEDISELRDRLKTEG